MTELARAAALPLWQPLRRRDFRLLWTGETISLLGDQFHFVALAWLTRHGALVLAAVLFGAATGAVGDLDGDVPPTTAPEAEAEPAR